MFPWNLGSFLVGLANKSISIGSDFPASASLEATGRRSELVVLIQHLAIFKCQHAQRSNLSPQSFHLNGHPSLSRLRVANKRRPFLCRCLKCQKCQKCIGVSSRVGLVACFLTMGWRTNLWEKAVVAKKIASQQCTSRVGWGSEDQRMWVNELHTPNGTKRNLKKWDLSVLKFSLEC